MITAASAMTPANRLCRIHASERVALKGVPTLQCIARGNRLLSAPSAGRSQHAFDPPTTALPAARATATADKARATATARARTSTAARTRTSTTATTAVGRGSTVARRRFREDFRGREDHAIRRRVRCRGDGSLRCPGQSAEELDTHQQREVLVYSVVAMVDVGAAVFAELNLELDGP